MSENGAAKKTTKNRPPTWRQKGQNCVKMGWLFCGRNVTKIIQIFNDAKITHRAVPGSKRHPKSIQKASTMYPKGVQKASKFIQIRSHWNQNSEIPMQTTAKNLAPYQSFPTKRHHKIGTVAGCAAHWILSKDDTMI